MFDRIVRLFPPLPAEADAPDLVILPLPAAQKVWIIEDYRGVEADIPEESRTEALVELYGSDDAVAIAVRPPDAGQIAQWGAQWATPAYALVQRRLTGTPVLGAMIPQWVRIEDAEPAHIAAFFNEHDARRALEARRHRP